MFSESGESLTHRDIFRGIIYICIPFLKIPVTVLPLFLSTRLSRLVGRKKCESSLTRIQIPKVRRGCSVGHLVLCAGAELGDG